MNRTGTSRDYRQPRPASEEPARGAARRPRNRGIGDMQQPSIGHMQQSKVIALRPAPGHDQSMSAGPALSSLPAGLAEDLRWVLEQLREKDLRGSPAVETDDARTRRSIRIAIGSFALVAAAVSLTILAADEASIRWPRSMHDAQAPASPAPAAPIRPPLEDPPASQPGTDGQPRAPVDLSQAAKARKVQQRLADLGFFLEAPNGTFGPRSRQALREFKAVNGLPADDRWDARTEAALADRQALGAAETFIGTWASEAAECRPQDAGIHIGLRRAEGYGGACVFGPIERAGSGWRVGAICAANGSTWRANISLAVSGDRLRWSSERGTAVYVRCGGSRRGAAL